MSIFNNRMQNKLKPNKIYENFTMTYFMTY